MVAVYAYYCQLISFGVDFHVIMNLGDLSRSGEQAASSSSFTAACTPLYGENILN